MTDEQLSSEDEINTSPEEIGEEEAEEKLGEEEDDEEIENEEDEDESEREDNDENNDDDDNRLEVEDTIVNTKKKDKKIASKVKFLASKESVEEKTGQNESVTAMKGQKETMEPVKEVKWSDLNLDDRLLKAMSKLSWKKPSPVQVATIPLAMQCKDVIARAKTGSGKTGAYMMPLLQKLLDRKIQNNSCDRRTYGLILTPSKELSNQAFKNAQQLTAYCSKDITCVDLSSASVSHAAQLLNNADIVVSTPSKLLAHINNQTFSMESIEYIVVDETDLIVSYGYENDMKSIVSKFPKTYQAILVSATLGKDVDSLKGLILRNPVTLQLDETDLPGAEKLSQFVVRCEPDDKYLLFYSLFKLNLVRGKSLVFVNTLDGCYRLKLFFEQFFINACIINAQLPQNSRVHIVDEFNRGVYDIVIATDSAVTMATNITTKLPLPSSKKGKKKKTTKNNKKQGAVLEEDDEFNVSRGIDFQNVDNVLNFDFPESADSYVHRVGRTARADNTGTALSLVATPTEKNVLDKVEEKLSKGMSLGSDEKMLKPYMFKMDQVEGFRYRVVDACNSITRQKVKDARLKEIKQEMFTSQKLKTYFEDNPKDLKVLKCTHDKVISATAQKPEMKNVPDYLVPDSIKHCVMGSGAGRKRKQNNNSRNKQKGGAGGGGKQDEKLKKSKESQVDPLKTFKLKKKT